MIFVDTSVWVEYFRGQREELVNTVDRLLDDDQVALAVPVRIELLSGASKKQLPRLGRVLSALPLFAPSTAVWSTMEQLIEVGIAPGQRFGVADLLIASIASENQGEIWSLDDDFARMTRLGFVRISAF